MVSFYLPGFWPNNCVPGSSNAIFSFGSLFPLDPSSVSFLVPNPLFFLSVYPSPSSFSPFSFPLQPSTHCLPFLLPLSLAVYSSPPPTILLCSSEHPKPPPEKPGVECSSPCTREASHSSLLLTNKIPSTAELSRSLFPCHPEE